MSVVRNLARAAKQSGKICASLNNVERSLALTRMAESLMESQNKIKEANDLDLEAARNSGLAPQMVNRLGFAGQKFTTAIQGIHDLAQLPDPIGHIQFARELADGLKLQRVTVPLGVLGIIFESRPDAAVQIGSLAVKSGNGVLLKCGKEAVRTCTEIVSAMHAGLRTTSVPPETIALLVNREQTAELLQCDGDVDLIIPRGSNSFVQHVQQNSKIPVLGHADGICHVYVDEHANLEKALKITIDSKTQYPSACNAMETLLVHKNVAEAFIPMFIKAATEKKVLLNGCEKTILIAKPWNVEVKPVETYAHEYCDLECAIKVVDDVEEGLNHISDNGSKHTDCIVTEDDSVAKRFLQNVASAGVFHNASTRFADGFRYGFGAEVGVSTSTMPPRGPVGLEGITTYKYILQSDDSHTVTQFATGECQFTHKDL